MAQHIEGEWKNFQFKMAKPEHFQNILIHMQNNFYKDEILCKTLGLDEAYSASMDASLLEVLQMNQSFIAVDKQTGKIAGVRLTVIEEKGIPTDLSMPTNSKHLTILGYLDKCCEDEGDVFKRYPDIDKYGNFFMASVDSSYRGQGLVTEMYKRAIASLKAQGIPLIKVICSSPFTRKAAANLGFVEIKSVRVLDYEVSPGVLGFPNAKPDDTSYTMVLRLVP